MRLRKRVATPTPDLLNQVVSCISSQGLVIGLVLQVDSTDSTGETDPFFISRLNYNIHLMNSGTFLKSLGVCFDT